MDRAPRVWLLAITVPNETARSLRDRIDLTEVSTMQPLEQELAPESILPTQLYGAPFGGARRQPEKQRTGAARL